MMKKQVFLIFAALLMTAQGAWADFVVDLSGSGTEVDPYVIEDADDWNTLATSVNSGNTFSGQFVKMTADITLPATAKSIGVYDNNANAWQGTFDGNGHTLTVAYNKTTPGRGIAPFMHIYAGAVIKNLCVKGSISTNTRVVASIVAQAGDASSTETMTCTIEKCWSEVAITSSISGTTTYAGGLVSEVQGNTTLNMTDCAFLGSFTYSSDSFQGGGLVSYLETNGIANLTRCTFVPSALNMVNLSKTGTIATYTFVGGVVKNASFDKCYYDLSKTDVNWLKIQGIDGSSMTAAVLAATLANGWGVKDGNAVPLMANVAVFTDADTYTLTSDKAVTSATYKKTINESRLGKFQAWFVPFEYTITPEDAENFQFYKFNMIARSENAADKIEIHLLKAKPGDVMYANKPYVYKPRKVVENYEFTTNSATLKAKKEDSRLHVETAENEYDFYGTYDVKSPTLDDPFYYVNINGDLSWGNDGSKVKVGAFRWIIRVKPKELDEDDYYVRGIVFSEEDGNEATGINSIDNAQLAIDNYYDMNGRKLDKKPTQKGVYINNGRKIIIK